MKRNKTQASDQYVLISTPGTLCEGYSMPYIKQFKEVTSCLAVVDVVPIWIGVLAVLFD